VSLRVSAPRFRPRPRLPGGRVPWGRLLVGAAALVLLVPNSSVLEHRLVVAVFLVALAAGRGRRFVWDWLPLVAAAAAFVVLRQFAAESPFPRRGLAVAALEQALFGGTLPSTWMQQTLRGAGSGPAVALDYAATAVHASYFFGFVAVGGWLWLRAHHLFRHYVRTLALTFALGLAGYVALPTEPPWLVARDLGGPPAQRIIVETTKGAPVASAVVEAGRAWQHDPDALGDPNPAAAMPSVHTAVTAAVGLFLFRIGRLAGASGVLYTLAMGLALVYLGEHFVLDVLAGIACAALAVWLGGRAMRRPGLRTGSVPAPAAGDRR
jgi:membrane-associated phospholipid phosphatase